VTLTLAKRKGTNATDITLAAEKKIESLRGYLLPADLNVAITRNYGETAKDKSNELLKHLAIATLSVTLLIALALGW
jgi:multidrug efflux pump subunit AcrB